MDQKNVSIRLSSIQESKFLYNTDFDYSLFQEQFLQIEFNMTTSLTLDQNLFHLEVIVKYRHQDSVLLEVGALFNFEIIPLSSVLIKQNNKSLLPENVLMNMMNTAIGTIRGIMFLKTQNTALEKFILPLLPANAIAELVKNHSN